MNRGKNESSDRDDRNDSKPTSVAFTISLNDSDENDDDDNGDNGIADGGYNVTETADDFVEKTVRVSSRKSYLDEKFAARSSRYAPNTKNLTSTESATLVTKMPRKSTNSMTSSVYDRLEACKQKWRNEARKLNLDLSKKNTMYDSGSDKDLISFESPECDDSNADENGSAATNGRSFMFHKMTNDETKSVVDQKRLQQQQQKQLPHRNKSNSNYKGTGATISLIDKSIENDLNRLADDEGEENGDVDGDDDDDADAGSDERHSVCSNETYVYDSNKYTDEEKARLSIDDYFKTPNTTKKSTTSESGGGPHNLPEMTFEEKTTRFFDTYNTGAIANRSNMVSTRLEKRIRQLLESKKAAAAVAATASRPSSSNDSKELDASRRKQFNYVRNLEPETDSDQDRMLEVAFSVPLKEINSKKSKVVVNVSQKKTAPKKAAAAGSAQPTTGSMPAQAENGCRGGNASSGGCLQPETVTENCFRAEISLCGSAGSGSSQNLHNNSKCDTQSFLKQTRQFISALEAKLGKNDGRRKIQAYTDEEKLQSSNDLAAIRNSQRLFVKQTQRSTTTTATGISVAPSSKIPQPPVLRRTNQTYSSTNRMNDLARSSSYTMPATVATSTPTGTRKASTASGTFRDRSLSRTNRFAITSPIQKSASARLVLSSATSSSSIEMDNDGDEEYAALAATKSSGGSSQLTQTRYNRAFALRRARLEVAEKIVARSSVAPQVHVESVPMAAVAPTQSVRNRLRQSLPSSRTTQASPPPPIPRSTYPTTRKSLPRLPHPTSSTASNSTATFARQSSARSSLGSCSGNGVNAKMSGGSTSGIALSSSASRLSSRTKPPQIAVNASSKSRAPRKSTGRSTAALKDPKIVEKQLGLERWNRRKSYNPLKAASEGRKRDFEKKCQQQQQHGSDLMVRSCLDSIESRNDETDNPYVTHAIDASNNMVARGSTDNVSANDIRRSHSYGDSHSFYGRKLIAEYIISSDSEDENYVEDDDGDGEGDGDGEDNGVDADNFSKTVFIS